MSSGSLRAHVELLEQRLQTPSVLHRHPLLSHRGRHEHGVEREQAAGGGVVEADERESGLLAFIFVLFWVDGAETPLVRFISTSDPKCKTNQALDW